MGIKPKKILFKIGYVRTKVIHALYWYIRNGWTPEQICQYRFGRACIAAYTRGKRPTCKYRNWIRFTGRVDKLREDYPINGGINLAYNPYSGGASSFLDDEITNRGYPSYNEYFDLDDEKWDEYCAKNKEVFLQKLEQRWESVKEFLDDEPTILDDEPTK